MKLLDQKGSSLLLTLLIITLAAILSTVLFQSVLSVRMQTNKTEEVNAAYDLAEMGLTYYKTIIEKTVAEANQAGIIAVEEHLAELGKMKPPETMTKQEIQNYYDGVFCNKINNNPDIQDSIGENISIDDSILIRKIEARIIKPCSGNEDMLIEVQSEGLVQNESRSIIGSIKIKKAAADIGNGPDEGIPAESLPAFDLNVGNSVIVIGMPATRSYSSSVDFHDSVDVRGNKTLTIDGQAKFSKDLTLRGKSSLIVNGNAFFDQVITTDGVPYYLCVKGDAYLLDSAANLYKRYEGIKNSCGPPNTGSAKVIQWTTSTYMDVKY